MKDLRSFTPARVALGRAGNSLPTAELLDFQLAHARARDAVHHPFDALELQSELARRGWPSTIVRSAARDRETYLTRPDLGRRLDPKCAVRGNSVPPLPPCVIVLADGLSPQAVTRHAIPLLTELIPLFEETPPIVIAGQARVALGDEIGELMGAECVAVLIGERPGLTSPDSMGAYLTWAPRIGRTDAERNCISNIRPEGLPPPAAARLLHLLLSEARRRRLSGVNLKVELNQLPDPGPRP